MIQQILPPQKPLLLHINITSEKIFSGNCRSFQDIPQAHFGADIPRRRRDLTGKPTTQKKTGEWPLPFPGVYSFLISTDRPDTYPER